MADKASKAMTPGMTNRTPATRPPRAPWSSQPM
jgi:hypothetical protein